VIDRDGEFWRGAPAAMFAVVMILGITTIAGALRSAVCYPRWQRSAPLPRGRLSRARR